jgi:hypothetical protein
MKSAVVLTLLALLPRPATPFHAAPGRVLLRCSGHGAGSARCASLLAHRSLRMQAVSTNALGAVHAHVAARGDAASGAVRDIILIMAWACSCFRPRRTVRSDPDELLLLQGGGWSSPRGENRHDLARDGDQDGLPGRPGGDGRVGGSEEIRMSPGARRMTPAERIDAMVSPMETGVVSNKVRSVLLLLLLLIFRFPLGPVPSFSVRHGSQEACGTQTCFGVMSLKTCAQHQSLTAMESKQVNAKGFSQKQVLQETISAGDDWWAGDTIDLQTDLTSLPPDWVQEQSAGATYYRNTVTGMTTRTRPKLDALSSTAASPWLEQGYPQLDEGLIDVAFPASFEAVSDAEMRVQTDKMEAEGAGLGEEDEESTRTLIRKIMQGQEQAEAETLAGNAAGPAPPGGIPSSARPTANAGRAPSDRRAGDGAQGAGGEDEGEEKDVAGEEEALIKLVFTSAEPPGRLQSPPPPPPPQTQAQVDGGTETILRKIEAASLSGAADLAPIQGIDAEGSVIGPDPAAATGAAASAGRARRAGEVPEHLRPGNNAGQMNWAETQLAKAQQNQRPLSDLPGSTSTSTSTSKH